MVPLVTMKCVACGNDLDPAIIVDSASAVHPTCLAFSDITGEDPFSLMLKQQLTEIIVWADKQNPRSKQVAIGPSEIGDPCDRRIGYRIAGVEPCNVDFDPWAGIVGTALHSWLDHAVQGWMQATGEQEWTTEHTLKVNEFVEGHSDLYSHKHQAVIDWKGAGTKVLAKVKKHGPPAGYQIQTHIYGYGFEQQGWPVKKVALVFLPRAGWLRDMYVWSADYDRTVAEHALQRMYEIARKLVDLNVLTQSHRWEQISAYPSDACGFCPLYDPRRDMDRGADGTGCPGR